MRELEESRKARADDRKRDEAVALRGLFAGDSATIALDETGCAMTSAAFAALVGSMRDAGRGGLDIVIGGPDGLDPDLRRNVDAVVSFGAMTWPHQIVRILASEQIYRAITILAGHPYHRA